MNLSVICDYMQKMKCVLLILLPCSLFFAPALHAQHFMAGVSAGPLCSDVQGTDIIDYDNDFLKVGYSVGAFVNREFGEKNIVQIEINYIQKGTEQLPDSNNNGYFKFTLNYVEVPLLIRHRIHFNLNRKFYNNFEWELGVSGGYLFSYNYTSSGYSLPIAAGSLNKIDVSVLGGINYILPKGFYFGVRYSNSVIPVIKHSAIPIQSFSSYNFAFNNGDNMVFQFCLKYVIAGNQTP